MFKNKKYIEERFDLETLYEIGFIKSKTDFDEIEKRICDWFDLDDIKDYDNIMKKELNLKNINNN